MAGILLMRHQFAEGGATMTQDALAELYFRGDRAAARCLFEFVDDEVALHVPGGAQRNRLTTIDWWPYIATLLDNHDIGGFEFDVIQKGTANHTRAFIDAKTNASLPAISAALSQGATLRIFGVSRFEPNCAQQLRLLREVLRREAFVNLYITPAQCPGLKLHYDLEDSIAVQVKGEKVWKLFGQANPRYPRELAPFTSQTEPKQIVHMRAGDVLFVPSGVVHTVETRDSISQHLTFGIHVSRTATTLSALLDEFTVSEEALRRPLRSDETVSDEQLASWAGRFQEWLARR
ncbi:MAG: cupin domain-containing protein [Hyphomonadaceae bacterium]